MKRNKMLKFNEWTSWRDDLYDEPEREDPETEYRNQLRKKESEEETEEKRKKEKTKKVKGVVVPHDWKPREVEELTDKYHWTEKDLKDMKLI